MCFELVTHIMERIGCSGSVVEETHGFKYFDDRDLLGFVDGTENPRAGAALRCRAGGRRRPAVHGRQLRYRSEVPARPRPVGRAAHRSAGADHRAQEAVRHRVERRGEAHFRPQRADDHCRERKRGQDSPGQHAVRESRRTASSGPASSATAGRPARQNRCSRTCSSGGHRGTTTGCWISAGPSPEPCFSRHQRRFSTASARTSDQRLQRVIAGLTDHTGDWGGLISGVGGMVKAILFALSLAVPLVAVARLRSRPRRAADSGSRSARRQRIRPRRAR